VAVRPVLGFQRQVGELGIGWSRTHCALGPASQRQDEQGLIVAVFAGAFKVAGVATRSVEFAVLQEFLTQGETSRLDASRHDVLPMFGSDEAPEVAGIGGSHDHAAFAERRGLSGEDDVRIQCRVMRRGLPLTPRASPEFSRL